MLLRVLRHLQRLGLCHIPPARQPALRNYKYAGTDRSLLSRYLLTPYWNSLVSLFPRNIAPNLITLTGFLFVIVNFTTLLFYQPSLQCAPKPSLRSQGGTWDPIFLPRNLPSQNDSNSEFNPCPPSYIWFSFAIGLFLYQSFDAIDGKQARRTGTSGPLGEMFDHGCDALNTTLEAIICGAALNLGQSWWTVASQIATLTNFYLTTWEEYHTSVLYLSPFSGPVEGILIIVGIYIVTGIKGPAFWDQGILTVTGLDTLNLSIPNIPLNDLFLALSGVGLVLNILTSCRNVIRARKARDQDTFTPLLGLMPLLFYTCLNVVHLSAVPEILRHHLVAFTLTCGFTFAYHVGLLIVAHVTKAPFPMFHVLMIYPILSVLDSFFLPKLLDMQPIFNSTPQGQLLWVYAGLVCSIGTHAFFVWDVISTICRYFDINCLTLKTKNM